MRTLIKTALIAAATLASVTVVEAMPAMTAVPGASVGGAQIEKAAVVVTTRRVVRRPRVVKRVIIR